MSSSTAATGEYGVVDADHLRDVVSGLFEHAGLATSDAALCADVLVTADLRGVTSHGVSNLLRQYLGWLEEGTVNPRPSWKVVQERRSTAAVDADRGLGVVIAPKAMEIAMEKAKSSGVGMVAIANGRHLGMASYHAMMALKAEMLGMCMTAVGPRVLPTWGREPRLGTNPIAFAAPAGDTFPFVYDASTAAIAHGKLRLAHRHGEEVAGGLYGDENGTAILDRSVPPASLTMLPLGSTRETGSHKGYGLGAMVEILCSMLSGSQCMALVGHGAARHFVAAIDIEGFTSLSRFKESIDEFHRLLADTAPATGHERVVVPGQLEWEEERERRLTGIPLRADVIDWLREAARGAGTLDIELRSSEAAGLTG